MTEQVREHRMTQEQRDEARDETASAAPAERSEVHEETLAHTDDLLDEIDEALEGLVSDVATSFRQKGGE